MVLEMFLEIHNLVLNFFGLPHTVTLFKTVYLRREENTVEPLIADTPFKRTPLLSGH